MTRLVEIWNGIPGETPVTRFTDRKRAVSRIWKAIQGLGAEASAVPGKACETIAEPAPAEPANVGPQAADVASTEGSAIKKASHVKKGPKADKEPGVPREGSKTSQVIAMLKREGGTTLQEIMTATRVAEAHDAGYAQRRRLADQEPRADRHQREGWRPATLLDQSLVLELVPAKSPCKCVLRPDNLAPHFKACRFHGVLELSLPSRRMADIH
jgi:hypothetical protein